MADRLASSHNKTKSKSRSPTPTAISIMKSMRCPRGTRRLKDKCVKIEDYLLQQSMIPRKNCPKGTRRSVTGKCIKDEEYLVEHSQRLRKQCQSGTRRDSKGDCIPFTPVEKPVTLLGQNNLFQVSFNKRRLAKYEPVITVPSLEGIQQPGSITLINSMVALGLLDSDKEEEYTVTAKKHVIDPLELLPDVFGMERGSVIQDGLMNSRNGFEYIEEELNRELAELEPNNATLLHIYCSNYKDFPTSSDWDHYIIAFKDKSKRETGIKYYDPQSKRFMSSLEELFPGNQLLSEYLDEKGKGFSNPDAHKNPFFAKHHARLIEGKYLFEIFSCGIYRVSSSENRKVKRIDEISVKDDSPRTGYFNEHFSEPVRMLGRTQLVQFSVTPEQFEEYVNFTYETGSSSGWRWSGGSCVLHSLFSLGLRNSTQVKRDAKRMSYRPTEKGGIANKKTARYLAKIAGLPKGSIIVVTDGDYGSRPIWRFISKEEEEEYNQNLKSMISLYSQNMPITELENKNKEMVKNLSNKNFDRMIDRYLNKHLENNHATIISICFKEPSNENKPGCHAIVAYKRNNKVEFFDPQTDKKNAGRSTVKDCMSTYGDFIFTRFDVFAHSTPLEHDILIDDERSCHIPFSGSPNVSPDSPLDDLQSHASIRSSKKH